VVLVSFMVPCRGRDTLGGERSVFERHPVRPRWHTVLKCGDKAFISLAIVIEGMEGFALKRHKLVCHGTRLGEMVMGGEKRMQAGCR